MHSATIRSGTSCETHNTHAHAAAHAATAASRQQHCSTSRHTTHTHAFSSCGCSSAIDLATRRQDVIRSQCHHLTRVLLICETNAKGNGQSRQPELNQRPKDDNDLIRYSPPLYQLSYAEILEFAASTLC